MSLIFTSIPSPVNNITSSIFIDNGNAGQSPAKVSDINIFPLPITTNLKYAQFCQYFYVHVAAAMKDVTLKVEVTKQPLVSIEGVLKSPLFPTPPVGIAMTGMNAEDTINRMSRLGFIKESVGRAPFFRGTVTDENIQVISNLRANIDTSVPYGITNLRGWLTYRLCEKIIAAAFKAFPGTLHKSASSLRVRSYKNEYSQGAYTVEPTSYAGQGTTESVFVSPKNFETQRFPGFVLPYFPTLLLPDRLYVPDFFARHFFSLLANADLEMDSATSTMSSIRQGWKTLSTTQSGLYLQHMTFCLDLALRTGARPLVLIKEDGSYIGCALSTPVAVLVKNNQRTLAGDAQLMPKTLQSLSQHDLGISGLIAALNKIPDEKRDLFKDTIITKHHLSSPRQIHNLVRRFRLSNEEQSSILLDLKKLSFTNEYWSMRDLSNIERVASAIANERFLDDNAPMPYDASYIFTNDICMSSLGVFGKKAPSPFNIRDGEVIVIPHATKSAKFFDTKLPNGKTVQAVGLYIDSLTEAANSWRMMKTNGTMKIHQKRKELVGSFWSFPKASPSAVQLVQVLTTHFGKSIKEKKEIKDAITKRKRGDEVTEVRKGKRARTGRSEMGNLLHGLGLDVPDEGDASMEEFEEDEPTPAMDED